LSWVDGWVDGSVARCHALQPGSIASFVPAFVFPLITAACDYFARFFRADLSGRADTLGAVFREGPLLRRSALSPLTDSPVTRA